MYNDKFKIHWRWVPGYEGRYKVSEKGEVISYIARGKEGLPTARSLIVQRQGYLTIMISKKKGETPQTRFVHRLVALAFIPNENDYPCVNHIDADKANNHVDNLEWCTHRQNSQHALSLGLMKPPCLNGERIPRSKLTEDGVLQIRKLHNKNPILYSQSALAREYGVSSVCVNSIVHRRTWKHI